MIRILLGLQRIKETERLTNFDTSYFNTRKRAASEEREFDLSFDWKSPLTLHDADAVPRSPSEVLNDDVVGLENMTRDVVDEQR